MGGVPTDKLCPVPTTPFQSQDICPGEPPSGGAPPLEAELLPAPELETRLDSAALPLDPAPALTPEVEPARALEPPVDPVPLLKLGPAPFFGLVPQLASANSVEAPSVAAIAANPNPRVNPATTMRLPPRKCRSINPTL
jgi:hypothetical protein